MRVGRIVEAFGADKQIVQNSIAQDRFFNDARNIFNFDVPVEDALRINRDTRPMLALVQTAGSVGSHERPQPACLDLGLEGISQRFRPFGVATPAWMTGSALITTDKQMVRECGHFSCYFSNLTHEICVTNWLSDANDRCAFVAKRGVLFAGKVASEASPTRNTLKSFERFS